MSEDPLKAYWNNRRREQEQPQTQPPRDTNVRNPEFLTLSPDRFVNRQNSGSTQGGSSAPKVVNLKEGDQYYCQVEPGGYGTADNLAIVGGIVGGATSKNVYVKGERTFYLLGDKVNDLGKVNEGQRICLVQVEVPFVGTFFVKKESIVQSFGSNNGANNNGKQLLRG